MSGRARRWSGSAAFAVCGVAFAVAQVIGHHVGQAAFDAALFAAIAVALAVGGRNETVRIVRGDLTDERLEAIKLRSVAVAGRVVTVVLLVAFLVEVALGHSGAPYYWLAAIDGATYAAVYFRGIRR
jgi:site-specific recombinase